MIAVHRKFGRQALAVVALVIAFVAIGSVASQATQARSTDSLLKPVACPKNFDLYPAAISSFLNRKGATPSSLRTWLKGCGVITNKQGTVQVHALDGIKEDDVVVVIHNPATDAPLPVGKLLVYHRVKGKYSLAHQGGEDGRVRLLAVDDLNKDGRREIAWTSTNCGAHTCYSTLYVDQWDGNVYRDWILGRPTTANATYSLRDNDEETSSKWIVVHGGVIGSVGAGPQRAWTENYVSYPEEPYMLFDKTYDDSSCLYHHLLDANDSYDRGDVNPELYYDAIFSYEEILDNADLEACAFSEFPDELDVLRDFARFRLVVAHTAVEEPAEAAAARADITTPALAGAAGVFLTEYNDSNNLKQACAETAAFAEANPDSWNYLEDWGYANPSFSAEQLCAGSAAIVGTVWWDQCTYNLEAPAVIAPVPDAGCVEVEDGLYVPNGIWEADEQPGISDVVMTLVSQACDEPVTADTYTTTVTTDIAGFYEFSGLESGSYCVVIDMADPQNADVIFSGYWTYPDVANAEDSMRFDVNVEPGDTAVANFGRAQ